MGKLRQCLTCKADFEAPHGLSRFCSDECRRAGQTAYKNQRYAAGFVYRKKPGERYFPKPCTNCGDVFQPRSGRDNSCAACKQNRDKMCEEPVGALLRSCRSRYPDGFDLSRSWFEALWVSQQGRCAVSGIEMTRDKHKRAGRSLMEMGFKVSIDRVDSSVGYLQANCRLVCVAVNLMRNNMTDEQLKWWCSKIIENK